MITNSLILLIIVLVITIIYYNNVVNDACDTEPKHYVFDSDKKEIYSRNKKTILMIAGTHGNEPAGSYSLNHLINLLNKKQIELKSIKLIIIPEVNYCALKNNSRSIFGIGDINRQYFNETKNKINKSVMKFVDDADIILDFHEGWGYHKINNHSVGSTISIFDNNHESILANMSGKLGYLLVDKINQTRNDKNKQFTLLLQKSSNEINHSLRQYCKNKNKEYILIETSGQNDIQELQIRHDQNMIVINTVLSYLS